MLKSIGPPDDHLRQGEPADAAQKRLPMVLASPSSTEDQARVRAGPTGPPGRQGVFEPWLDLGAGGNEDLERCERGGIAEGAPASINDGMYTVTRRRGSSTSSIASRKRS